MFPWLPLFLFTSLAWMVVRKASSRLWMLHYKLYFCPHLIHTTRNLLPRSPHGIYPIIRTQSRYTSDIKMTHPRYLVSLHYSFIIFGRLCRRSWISLTPTETCQGCMIIIGGSRWVSCPTICRQNCNSQTFWRQSLYHHCIECCFRFRNHHDHCRCPYHPYWVLLHQTLKVYRYN